jgi:hypothetical protein
MQDAALLTPAQRAIGYHNPARGDYRLAVLGARLKVVLTPEPPLRWPSTLA